VRFAKTFRMATPPCGYWLRDRKQNDTAFLLVIDQFEELFTFADPKERRRFDAQLAAALEDPDCPLFVFWLSFKIMPPSTRRSPRSERPNRNGRIVRAARGRGGSDAPGTAAA
jgi:hypothetical protein